jgi:hypothetical protein
MGEARNDRRALIEAALKERPDVSDRSIAAKLGVSPTTVGAARKKAEDGVQIGHQEKRVGKDGVAQPARKKAPPPEPEKPKEKPAYPPLAFGHTNQHRPLGKPEAPLTLSSEIHQRRTVTRLIIAAMGLIPPAPFCRLINTERGKHVNEKGCGNREARSMAAF